MLAQLSLNELPGVFIAFPCCCKNGLMIKGSFPWVGIFLESESWRWATAFGVPLGSSDSVVDPVLESQLRQTSHLLCPTWKMSVKGCWWWSQQHAHPFCIVSYVCPAPESIFFAFRFHFQSQNSFFFFFVRVVTLVDFCPKPVPVEIQCFLCLWCFFIIGGFNIKKLKKMAAV